MWLARFNVHAYACLWHEIFWISCLRSRVDPACTPSWPLTHVIFAEVISETDVFPVNITSLFCHLFYYFFYFLFLALPLQCTQGTKGLLESAALSPLLSTSCPQGKPQNAHSCPETSPALNSDPTSEFSKGCRGNHTSSSHGDPSRPRHTKARSKKCRREALHIPNPAFDVPVSPTSPDAAPDSKARSHKGGSLTPLHWLSWMMFFTSQTLFEACML